MKLGAMNNPAGKLIKEIEWIGSHGFEYIDLTLEVNARPERIDIDRIKGLLDRFGLDLVGHTPWFLPAAVEYQELIDASFNVFLRCLEVFKNLGATIINIHPFPARKILGHERIINLNIETITRVVERAQEIGLSVAVENVEPFYEIDDLAEIINSIPDLNFHLDIGHVNLSRRGTTIEDYFNRFGSILRHIHISDNLGSDDLHLPIGAGNINWKEVVKILKRFVYDQTITLEVFSRERDYLSLSREKFLKLWNSQE